MVKLMIADDHEISAAGTVKLLWETWPDIAIATSIDQAIRQLDGRPVDALILDVMFRGEPDRSGFTILRHCVAQHPATRILLLTGFDDPMTALAARDQGAHGCVGKHTHPEQLVDALRTVLGGDQWWGDLLRPPTLTRQQLAVLGFTARGHTQQETANQLGLALITVESHLKEARRRLRAENSTHAAYLAERLGMIVPDEWPESPRLRIQKTVPPPERGSTPPGGGGGASSVKVAVVHPMAAE